MTNKKQLQKEIKDEGYESDNPSRNNRNNKNLVSNKTTKQLEKEVKFWSQTASNHLTNLQREQAENENLKEEIKELKKQKPTKTQTELEKALIEANQKIRDQAKTIQDLTGKNSEIIKKLESKIKELNKTIQGLQKQVKNKEEVKEPINKSFFCDEPELSFNEWKKKFRQEHPTEKPTFQLYTIERLEKRKEQIIKEIKKTSGVFKDKLNLRLTFTECLIEGFKKEITMCEVGNPEEKLPLEATDEELEKASF
ncbi:5351_t:CDS:2 [Paraglomus brasilianum]|uniref:5351_t:CDS:1 n=1 Tax=Paraglomus brasilianum TaxID=144538 RepID=A0A9N9G1U6_9GLOM|nr:5351_t:CDS:2 [Paraglomus brasilianum]